MTDLALPAGRFAEQDFRVGRVISRTFSVFSRNFPIFFAINAVAVVPEILSKHDEVGRALGLSPSGYMALVTGVLAFVLSTLCQAVVLYGAFQDMSGRPVRLVDSVQIGLRRFFPIIGISISTGLLITFGTLLLIIPGVIAFTLSFVAIPACVVERLSPFASIDRSARLTKGYRWPILGMLLALGIGSAIISGVITGGGVTLVGAIPALILDMVWSVIWNACYAILAVVTYHDLRVAKEGVDTEQIAAVFE